MQLKCFLSTCSLLLVLSIPESNALARALSNGLMCYSCTNCPQVNTETPEVFCGEQYFITTEIPTSPQTSTETTDTTRTETVTDSSTTLATEELTTSEETTTDMSSETTSTSTITTETTTTGKPSPPTVGPLSSTTLLPTPPNPGLSSNTDLAQAIHDTMEHTTIQLSLQSHRRRRQAIDYSYHCYTVQIQNDSGNVTTNRGCARVPPQNGVCDELEGMMSENENITKCTPCTMPLCNNSIAARISLILVFCTMLAVAIV